MPPAADVDPVRHPGVEAGGVRLPRREDRRLDAGLREQPQRREVHGRLGQPHRPRRAPEPQLEVAQAPADLRPPIVDRRQRQDRVVERLRDRRVRALLVRDREQPEDPGAAPAR